MTTDQTTTLTFLERLRKNTAQSHTMLEALPLSSSITKPEVTGAEYKLYLSLMADVVKDAEENIYPIISDVVKDLESRKKAHFIEADLAILNAEVKPSSLPLSKAKDIISAGFALGIMYVVEGSTLGGRVILKNIKESLGYGENNGARYFAGYGGQTGSRWKMFLEVMVEYAEKHNCEDDIIAGADFAFTAISNHFIENSAK
ncbi:MAG: heme oxygenase [Flavobacterium sp.]|nr:MAG: heme oxygenase [Flavobacterium sp.]